MEGLDKITKLPPKRLALIAGTGVGLGLLWRHFAARKATAVVQTDASAQGSPETAASQYSQGVATDPVYNPNDAYRDLGGSAFPVNVSYGVVQGADGNWYAVNPDGSIRGEIPAAQVPNGTIAQVPQPGPGQVVVTPDGVVSGDPTGYSTSPVGTFTGASSGTVSPKGGTR